MRTHFKSGGVSRGVSVRSCVRVAVAASVAMLAVAAPSVRADVAQTWGSGAFGQLGNGAYNNSSLGVNVSGLDGTVTALAGGQYSSYAIQNGSAKAWGYGPYGGLGNGTSGGAGLTNTPVQVTGLTSGVTAIAGGAYHAVAIQNGAVKTWGYNLYGAIGNGSSGGFQLDPYSVSSLSSGVTAVAAGGFASFALQSGAVKAWGYGSFGGLGNGASSNSNTPVQVTGLTSNVTAIAAGSYHALALQNGVVKAWGYNGTGQLGNNTVVTSNVPVNVVGLTSGVTAIAGGATHSLAIKDGDVYAWGDDPSGEIGNGSATGSVLTPTKVLDLAVNLVDVAAGSGTSYALSSDGSLWVWGLNSLGQLGLDDTVNRDVPVQLFAPTGYKFTSIEAGPDASNALATIVVVPEPTAIASIALGATALLRRRRSTR